MIGHLSGKVIHKTHDSIILNVNGVGYVVYCSANIISALNLNSEAEIWIEMEMKQESIALYGFLDLESKAWFKILKTVQGVGSKIALAILASCKASSLQSAIMSGEVAVFKSVTGVGPKLAARIVNELQGKFTTTKPLKGSKVHGNLSANVSGSSVAETSLEARIRDASSAISNLGFNYNDTYQFLSDYATKIDKEVTLEEMIRVGLAGYDK